MNPFGPNRPRGDLWMKRDAMIIIIIIEQRTLFRRILRTKYRRAVGTHYGPTRMHQAGFSPRHRRDGRAGTTILLLVSAFFDRTKALISDYGPAGAAGTWATPPHPPGPQDRLWVYGPEEAAGSRRRPSCRYRRTFPRTTVRPGAADAAVDSAGAAVPSARNYGPDGSVGWLCRSTPLLHRGKRTTRQRDLPGAGRCVCPMLWILSQASTRLSTDRARAG